MAEEVAVAPRLTSKVVEKGVKTPLTCCQKLARPAQLLEVRQTVPVSLGKVMVLAEVGSVMAKVV